MYYGYWFGEFEHYEGVHGKHKSFFNAARKAFKIFKKYDDNKLWGGEQSRPWVITIMLYTLEYYDDEIGWMIGDVIEYWELPVELDEYQKEWEEKYGKQKEDKR